MKIEFYPSSKEVELIVPPPRPAAHYVPEWYKKAPKFSETTPNWDENGKISPQIKACVPFLDAITSGYIQETWQDIRIVLDNDNRKVSVDYPSTPEILSNREQASLPVGSEYHAIEFVWKIPWIPRVPKGWSVMFSPLPNRLDTPFTCATGIIDSDNFYHSPFGNYPFYLKSNFSGIIPKGTPMYLMTPIKRENWESSVHEWDADDMHKRHYQFASRFMGSGLYRDKFNIKKRFK